jgi:hypothetical protein
MPPSRPLQTVSASKPLFLTAFYQKHYRHSLFPAKNVQIVGGAAQHRHFSYANFLTGYLGGEPRKSGKIGAECFNADATWKIAVVMGDVGPDVS